MSPARARRGSSRRRTRRPQPSTRSRSRAARPRAPARAARPRSSPAPSNRCAGRASPQGSFRPFRHRARARTVRSRAEDARPYQQPQDRHRLPAGAHARGDARGHPRPSDRRRRLHGQPRRHLPDARRPPPRRPHELRLLRPRVGPVRAHENHPPRHGARAAHARESAGGLARAGGADRPRRRDRRAPRGRSATTRRPRGPRPPPEAGAPAPRSARTRRAYALAEALEPVVTDRLVGGDQRLSPGRWNTISEITQVGLTRSAKRTASATSAGRIISSAGTCSRMNSVIGVSTKPGHSASDFTPSPLSSLFMDCVQLTTAALVAAYTDSHGWPALPAI